MSALANVFAYGTLQFGEIMHAVTERSLAGEPATLPGYRRLSLTGRSYPGIVAAPDEATAGILYRDVDAESVARLDIFESEIYERLLLPVRTAGGRDVRAFAYVVSARFAHLLSPEPWSPEQFQREHGEAFLAACKRFREEGVA